MIPGILSWKAEDVGGTFETTFYLNDRPIYSYMPGTGYEDRALELAEEAVGEVFRTLLRAECEQ